MHSSPFSHLNQSKGFTLVEVIISLALLSISLLAVMGSFEYLSKSERQLDAVRARDELTAVLIKYGASLEALKISANMEGNEVLKDCLEGVTCDSYEDLPFSLYSMSGGLPDKQISGVPIKPLRYKPDGFACPPGAAASNECPLEVTTSFRPQCKPDLGPSGSLIPEGVCEGQMPELVEIFYKVKLSSGTATSNSQTSVNTLKTIEGSIIVEI